MLGFETLTLVPIDLRLIEPEFLTPEEKAWLDAYHARVRAALSPLLDAAERAWLEKATREADLIERLEMAAQASILFDAPNRSAGAPSRHFRARCFP